MNIVGWDSGSGLKIDIGDIVGAKLQPADQIEVDHYLVVIQEQLDGRSFEDALAEGRGMSFEDAVSFALDDQAS